VSVRLTGRTFNNVAIAGAELRLFNHCLARPEILLFKEILKADIRTERAVAPLVKGQRDWHLVAGVRNPDRIWPLGRISNRMWERVS